MAFVDLFSNALQQYGLQDTPAVEQSFAPNSLSQMLQPQNDGLGDLFNTASPDPQWIPASRGTGGYRERTLNAPDAYRGWINEAAQQYNIDPLYLQELIRAESDFNPRSTSHVGAAGLTQMMPATARAMGVTNPYDPKQSIFGGAKYLSQMLKRYNYNYDLALSAYNAGPGRVDKVMRIPNIRETQNYVAKINRRVAAIKAQNVINTQWRL